ncbi:MAG TPA: hypothetical protein VMX74_08065 [Pirellulales bacterium]|nr:hypothetical protein [Pirellulales bacterium]
MSTFRVVPPRSFRAGVIACLLAILASVPSSRAAESPAASLALVPQDAAYYTASLRLAEQVSLVKNSNWWQRVNEWDLVVSMKMMAQFGLMQGPGAQAMQMLEMPENQQLLELLKEMASDEVFCYGDAQTAGTISLLMVTIHSVQYGSMVSELIPRDSDLSQDEMAAKLVLDSLAGDVDNVVIPAMVIGFKVENNEAANQQLARLEALIKVMLPNLPPELDAVKNNFKRVKVGDSELLSATVDGSIVPWDEIPFEEVAENPGDYDALQKKLRELTLTISLGVHKGFFLISIGPSNEHLVRLGVGDALIDHAKLAPLRSHANQKITGIAYASEAMMQSAATNQEDVDQLVDVAKQILPMAELPEEEEQQILADAQELAKDVKPFIPTVGAHLAFNFLNGRGYESFHYNWSSNNQLDGSKPLPLVNHMGGSPLLAVLGRAQHRPQDYDLIVKWFKKGRDYFEKYAVEEMSEREQNQYGQFAEIAFPLLGRLDKINREMLIPSTADGQAGLAIDTESETTQWTSRLPATTEPIALPSPALVIGLKDADLFKKALGEYRLVVNDLIKKLHEINPQQIPDVQLPPAKLRHLKSGAEIFYYPLPAELGVYDRVAPNAAITETMAAFTLLPRHTQKIVKDQALEVDGGPLANTDRPLARIVYFDWANMVDTMTPWINEGVRAWARNMEDAVGNFELEEGFNAQVDGNMAKPVIEHVRKGMELLKAFRGYTSVTYIEDGVLVTHGESRFQDVD